MTELQQPHSIFSEPISARSFAEFVITALLLHQPHNYTEALRRLERPIMPRDVKRAIDYIEANSIWPSACPRSSRPPACPGGP